MNVHSSGNQERAPTPRERLRAVKRALDALERDFDVHGDAKAQEDIKQALDLLEGVVRVCEEKRAGLLARKRREGWERMQYLLDPQAREKVPACLKGVFFLELVRQAQARNITVSPETDHELHHYVTTEFKQLEVQAMNIALMEQLTPRLIELLGLQNDK